MDAGETPPESAAREELGIVIDPSGLTFTHLCHHADPDGQGLALLYPAWLKSLEQRAPQAAACLGAALGTDRAHETITQLLATIGLRGSLSDAGYHPSDIPAFMTRITGNTANDPHPGPRRFPHRRHLRTSPVIRISSASVQP